MTRLELVQELVRLCGIAAEGQPATTIGQEGALLKAVRYIDHAYQEIQNEYLDWNFLWATNSFSTVSGTAAYAGEADLNLWDVNEIYVDDVNIPVIDWSDYDRETTTNAKPRLGVIRPDNQLLLVPTPNAAYTVTYDYFKAPESLSANDDVPIIPAQFHMAIVGRAMIMYANFESAEEVKIQGQEIYQQHFNALRRSQLPRYGNKIGRHESVDLVVVAE